MKRNQLITSLTICALALVTVASAAYAPYSPRWVRVSDENRPYAPCRSTSILGVTDSSTTKPVQKASNEPLYPVPSEDVIARGHSGQVK